MRIWSPLIQPGLCWHGTVHQGHTSCCKLSEVWTHDWACNLWVLMVGKNTQLWLWVCQLMMNDNNLQIRIRELAKWQLWWPSAKSRLFGHNSLLKSNSVSVPRKESTYFLMFCEFEFDRHSIKEVRFWCLDLSMQCYGMKWYLPTCLPIYLLLYCFKQLQFAHLTGPPSVVWRQVTWGSLWCQCLHSIPRLAAWAQVVVDDDPADAHVCIDDLKKQTPNTSSESNNIWIWIPNI